MAQKTIIRLVMLVIVLMCTSVTYAENRNEEYSNLKNIPYLSINSNEKNDEYRTSRCKLDIYLPNKEKGFTTIIFFHGGGLEGGEKSLPEEFKRQKIAVVSPNYRLFPKVKSPGYIEDAAEAVAWCVKNIASYGGDPSKIYVCGHSAGGYLTLMLALDKSYLGKRGVDADSLAGYVSFSGQTNTHYTIRKERGMNMNIPVIDSMAPIFHSRKLMAPLVLCTGDRNMEMLARYTENLHLQDILRSFGNNVPLYEFGGFDHGEMLQPGCELMLKLIKKGKI